MTSENKTRDAFLYNGCVDRDVKRFAKDLSDSDLLSVDAFLEYRPDFLDITLLDLAEEDRQRETSLDKRKWFASRYGITDAELRRVTTGFSDRFTEQGYMMVYVGGQGDGALETLRNLPVIE